MVLVHRRASSALGRAALFACAALFIATLAGSVSPQADSINIVAPYVLLLAALILCVVIATASRLRRAALLVLLAGMATSSILAAPFVTAPSFFHQIGMIRLVSFNMYRANGRSAEAVDWLLAQNADIVVLLEAAPEQQGELKRLIQHFPYVYGCSAEHYCSTMILARQAARAVWPHAVGDADNRKALSALTASFDWQGQTVPITAVHLDRPWPLGRQNREMVALNIVMQTVARGGIVVGDFNSAPTTFAMRDMAAAGDVRLASGLTGTWPSDGAGLLRLPLDQLYLGPCLSAGEVSRGPSLGSDHFPLISDISVARCRG
jgi:endonuclease/exonuclease/phosphatase (EEP) superfamily protein YafD